MKLLSFIEDFFSVLYPRVCAACGNSLLRHEEIICAPCLYELPKTNFHLFDSNPLDKSFYGKVDVENCAALYYFKKQGNVQNLVHQLKYKGRKDVGIFLGRLLGSELAQADKFKELDTVIPIPLHPAKQRKRGYNQSEQITTGIAEVLAIEMDIHSLKRTVNTQSQTKKNPSERRQNVQGVFKVNNPDQLVNKHVLLVDDVITTGATIESAAIELKKIEGLKLSIACVGYAYD